ncbi:unnamed protein product [Adineta ricciae]|uniref:Uncharacterized protein n=1 Tax=Adineta ricciae TaxID=249248 RepID=A0A814DZI9_ADIRI|nr:unnamed protein product [Adineta ricciae]
MESKSTYSPFIEHSFRRLSLLIHQQDRLHPISNQSAEQSLDNLPRKTHISNDELISLPSKYKSFSRASHANEPRYHVEPMARTPRTYMRPPKQRTIVSYRCSSSQISDRSEASFNHSLESLCSPTVTKQESNELPIHTPHERSLYDMQFERDRQNDIRGRYNVPEPFQRTWLRQPRYVPQERPSFGEVHQSKRKKISLVFHVEVDEYNFKIKTFQNSAFVTRYTDQYTVVFEQKT